MNFATAIQGWTELELENGDRIKLQIVVGSITEVKGKKNPDGSQMYNMQHQIVSFVTPKSA